jgi:molybdopterin molybdotransferase
MISFEQALEILLSSAPEAETEQIPFMQASGRILAREICSDIDMPPFDKSAVDGFACRREDLGILEAPPRTGAACGALACGALACVATIPAGAIPHHPIGPGQCAKIMTGAMIPGGADTVIMVEDTEELPDGNIRFTKEFTAPNICYQGEDIRKGDPVLETGTLVTPQVIAVLASVGAINPTVSKQPAIAVISTGDELVDPGVEPGPAKLRNSNSAQLIAQVEQMHLKAKDLGISGDSKEALYEKIEEGLACSGVLILSGGVSMGDFDYVPAIMTKHGIEILFKSVAVQPGRPTVFGRKGNQFVFGLPGNPVSSFVIFETLVKPFLYKLMGHNYSPLLIRLPLAAPVRRRNKARKAILPVCIREGEIFPVNYHGSAHIHSYIQAHGLIAVETGITELKQGELHDVRLL